MDKWYIVYTWILKERKVLKVKADKWEKERSEKNKETSD